MVSENSLTNSTHLRLRREVYAPRLACAVHEQKKLRYAPLLDLNCDQYEIRDGLQVNNSSKSAAPTGLIRYRSIPAARASSRPG